MPSLKTIVINLLRRLDHFIDDLRFALVKVSGGGKDLPVKIATYRGFGRRDFLFLQGRVLVKKRLSNSPINTVLQNLINSYHRFESDEIPNAVLRVSIEDHQFDLTTDREGYFTLSVPLDPPLELSSDEPWQNVHITLLKTPWTAELNLETSTTVMFPPEETTLGIISDLDDTVIETGVASLFKWRAFYNTLFKSIHRRKLFDEVAAFFRALRRGYDDQGFLPLFYVSNSPRNIYDMVVGYLKVHSMPKAPVLLRDIGFPYKVHSRKDMEHKMESIVRIFDTYPEKRFILIGDNAEKDPYIYHEIDQRYPGRVAAIYIRDVQKSRPLQRLKKFVAQESIHQIQMFTSYRQLAEMCAEAHFLDWDYFQELCQSQHKWKLSLPVFPK
ncbi:App1 family protein [Haliscomenobacter sp.]|uniref:App1 family protein n=1 Tax=Haliscomenobacter sp. TaxID=2717303 RepID=UPI00359423FB